MAGGKSLVAALNMRLSAPRVLIDLNALTELSGISLRAGTITIGALTRHRTVEHSLDVATHLPLIHHAMRYVAHPAIRNRGTFGGSIAFADSAAELPACSVALGAQFRLASANGERTIPARNFFVALYETALVRGEVLVAADFPMLQPGYRSAFQEFARRHGDYAIVGLAAHAKWEAPVLSDVRLAYFGISPVPVLAAAAAAALEGQLCAEATIAQAQAALDEDLSPYDDANYSAAARMVWARVLLRRVVKQLTE